MIRMNVRKTMTTQDGERDLNVDVTIERGEVLALFGPSGAGKTTLLRLLAGLSRPDEGSIVVDGETWFDSRRRINLALQKRKVGFVFQDYSLFPNMTVRENLLFALDDRSRTGEADEWLSVLDLTQLADQKPHQLSGGQKQRAALARALVRRPEIVLLDEPLSALDIDLRLKLQDELIAVCRKQNITAILVSHDVSEVFKISRRVLVMKEGKIIRSGAPENVFVENNVSGKFKFTGEIVAIKKDGVVNILTVRIGNTMTQVVATDEEIVRLKIGSRVIVAAKAFNPMILEYNDDR